MCVCIYLYFILKEGSFGITLLCQKMGQTDEIKLYDKNSVVPTETLPTPASEPFSAGNTLVRSRRIHALLIWTSTWTQTLINI